MNSLKLSVLFPMITTLLTAPGGLRAGTLISPTIRNGGFENGFAAPWTVDGVSQNAILAAGGSWYAVLQASTTPLPLFPISARQQE